MKTFIAMTLFGFNVFAANYTRLVCIPNDPCQYADQGLKYCVSKIAISGRVNGTETVYYSPKNIGHDLLLVNPTYSVQINANRNHVSFMDVSGDQNGLLKPILGGTYDGKITVDQDFEFEVTCNDEAIGFE